MDDGRSYQKSAIGFFTKRIIRMPFPTIAFTQYTNLEMHAILATFQGHRRAEAVFFVDCEGTFLCIFYGPAEAACPTAFKFGLVGR
jgi:hypothetical protein